MIRRRLKIIGLFCRVQSLLQGSFAKETYHFKEPTNRSHPIADVYMRWFQQTGFSRRVQHLLDSKFIFVRHTSVYVYTYTTYMHILHTCVFVHMSREFPRCIYDAYIIHTSVYIYTYTTYIHILHMCVCVHVCLVACICFNNTYMIHTSVHIYTYTTYMHILHICACMCINVLSFLFVSMIHT